MSTKTETKRPFKVTFNKEDTFSLYTHLAAIILEGLQAYKVDCNGYPADFTTVGDWKACLDEMIWAFDNVELSEEDFPTHKAWRDFSIKREAGMNLFVKYFRSLWW